MSDMVPAPVPYVVEIKGHLGATVLSAFPCMTSHRRESDTVLTGLLDQSALHGLLAQVETLGLELLALYRLEPHSTPDHGAATDT